MWVCNDFAVKIIQWSDQIIMLSLLSVNCNFIKSTRFPKKVPNNSQRTPKHLPSILCKLSTSNTICSKTHYQLRETALRSMYAETLVRRMLRSLQQWTAQRSTRLDGPNDLYRASYTLPVPKRENFQLQFSFQFQVCSCITITTTIATTTSTLHVFPAEAELRRQDKSRSNEVSKRATFAR